jgi:hypothetical protein
MIVIPSFNNILTIGDFLLAPKTANAHAPSVCVVRDIIHPDQVRVTWWLTRIEILALGSVDLPPPLRMEAYSNLLKCRIQEVFEVCSSLATINIRDIHDLAFVFHADKIEKEYVNCAGMKRVFYTRYRCHADGTFVLVDCRIHIPFSNLYIESYPCRIWHFILHVKQSVEKLLNDAKQYQACRKMVVMKCSLECWHYFRRAMNNSNAIFAVFRRNHTEKQFHCDLMLSSHSTRKNLELVRIDTPMSMSCARELFGITFGVGIRNRAPNKGDNPVTMHHGDIVNLVNVNQQVLVDRDQEFVAEQGIDFLFESNSRSLKIRARYSRFLAQSEEVAATLNLNNRQLQQRDNVPPVQLNDVADRQRWLQLIEPGTMFMREGLLVEVLRVEGDAVVIQDETSFNEYIIDRNEAGELLQLYIE